MINWRFSCPGGVSIRNISRVLGSLLALMPGGKESIVNNVVCGKKGTQIDRVRSEAAT